MHYPAPHSSPSSLGDLAVQSVLPFPLQFQRQAPMQSLQRHGDDDAAAIPEPTAACAPFQRIAAHFPLHNNNNLATTSRVPAAHRRGKNANCAIEVHKP